MRGGSVPPREAFMEKRRWFAEFRAAAAHFRNIGFVQAFLPYMSKHSART